MSNEDYGNAWESQVTDDGAFIRHQSSFRYQKRKGRRNSGLGR